MWVFPFDLSRTLPVGGGLLVLCSSLGPPVIKTPHANGYCGAWPGWAASVTLLPLTVLTPSPFPPALPTTFSWELHQRSGLTEAASGSLPGKPSRNPPGEAFDPAAVETGARGNTATAHAVLRWAGDLWEVERIHHNEWEAGVIIMAPKRPAPAHLGPWERADFPHWCGSPAGSCCLCLRSAVAAAPVLATLSSFWCH